MRGLRNSAWLIVAAALLPLLLFVIFQVGYSAREQRRSIESRALARSEAVILATDARVGRLTAAIDALATAHSLRSNDLAEFRDRARELAQLSGAWEGVELIDPATGKIIASVGERPTKVHRTTETPPGQRAAFAGFAFGNHCGCLVFERLTPPAAGGRLLRVFVASEPFRRLLPSTRSEYPVSGIVSPNGLFIARTVNAAARFGQPGSEYLQEAAKGHEHQGVYRGVTLEGLESFTAFTRSKETGWSAHVALGSKYIDSPARRYLASLGFAALVSLLLAALLILFAIRQLAEARRLAERMEQAQKLEALGQLTGGIAHDFNNLLTPIVGALDILSKREELDARSRRIAEGGLASANRASKLTGQLLAFSRRQKLTLERVDLAALLNEMSTLLVQSAGDARLEIHFDCDSCWTDIDPTQLELALLNLILNARDASPSGARIDLRLELSTHRGKPCCRITVTDYGAGMNDEVRRRAFEPFFTTKSLGEGTGLGLAQVFALAQQSHGSVDIDSEPGEGTSVSLNLPRRDPPPEAARASAESKADWRRLRILVAEDEPEVRATIVAALEDDGHEVEAADGGVTALELLGGTPFDLLIADYAMPGMSGAELIAVARGRHPILKFLLVTGYLDSAAVESAAPGVEILAKPFEPDALRRTVQQVAAA